MERDGGRTPVGMPILPMRTALAHETEAVPQQVPLHLPRLEDRNGAQASGDLHGVGPDEFGFERWLPVLEEEFHDFLEVGEQFLHGGTLGVGPGPARDVADEQPGIGVSFHDSGIRAHRRCRRLMVPKDTAGGSGLTSARSWRARVGRHRVGAHSDAQERTIMLEFGRKHARSLSADR